MLFLFQGGMDFRFHVKLWGCTTPWKINHVNHSHLSWSIPWMSQLAIGEEKPRSVIIQSQHSAMKTKRRDLKPPKHGAVLQNAWWTEKRVKYQRRKKSKRRIHTFERNPQQKFKDLRHLGEASICLPLKVVCIYIIWSTGKRQELTSFKWYPCLVSSSSSQTESVQHGDKPCSAADTRHPIGSLFCKTCGLFNSTWVWNRRSYPPVNNTKRWNSSYFPMLNRSTKWWIFQFYVCDWSGTISGYQHLNTVKMFPGDTPRYAELLS